MMPTVKVVNFLRVTTGGAANPYATAPHPKHTNIIWDMVLGQAPYDYNIGNGAGDGDSNTFP